MKLDFEDLTKLMKIVSTLAESIFDLSDSEIANEEKSQKIESAARNYHEFFQISSAHEFAKDARKGLSVKKCKEDLSN